MSTPQEAAPVSGQSAADGVAFAGRFVQLEPITIDHVTDVTEAALADRSTFEWIDVPRTTAETEAIVMRAQRDPSMTHSATFVQRRIKDLRVLGLTHFVTIERWNGLDAEPTAVEIGNSWLVPEALRSPVDLESKLLLMQHAFETWKVCRIWVRTDSRNDRSRRALSRIGAQFEGVQRAAQPGTGDVGRGAPRDTAVYSVIASEWPTVKAGLVARIG